jgi:hypothetical protein
VVDGSVHTIYETSLYARDLSEQNSVKVLINHAAELGSSGPCGRREMFLLGGTALGNSKNLSHIPVTRISRKRLCCF